MDDPQENQGGATRSLVRLFDMFGYFIEKLRGAIIDSAVFKVERCVLFSRSLLKPKTGQGEEDSHFSREEDQKYCLHTSGLSFFDKFSCINGIPAFFLSQGKIKSNCEDLTPSSSVEKRQSFLGHSKRVRAPGSRESSSIFGTTDSVGPCSFSSDSSRFAICYLSGQISIWDVDHGALLKEALLEDGLVSSVSFLGTSNTVLLMCTQEYTCWKWEIKPNGSTSTKICDREKVSVAEGEIFSQRSAFYNNGTKLVFFTLINTKKGRILEVAVLETTSNPDELELYRIAPFEMDNDYVSTDALLSPDGKGILVGVMDQGLEDSYCLLWPNFIEDKASYKKLDKGTTGRWSMDSKHVVTWIMTNKLDVDVDDEKSAFIWNVEEICENWANSEYTMKPRRITNPFGDKVFWCQLAKDMEGKDRLIMGIIGETTRFLFIDEASKIHTHTIESGISAKDMILCSGEAWIEYYVSQRSVKGLSPMDLSSDRSMFGAALGLPSDLLVWDAHRGIEVLRIAAKDLQANKFKGGINLMMSPSSAKFAIVGSNGVVVFCPSTPSKNERRSKTCLETQMVQLDNPYTSQANLSSFKMSFSGDGDCLGVLRIGLSKMQVWNLPQGTSCTIDSDHNTEGGNVQDFCLSNNGSYAVINIGKSIQIMDCETKEVAQMVGLINLDSKVVSMGINSDASELVLCMEDGSMCWYELSGQAVQHNEENVPSTSNIHEVVGRDLSFMGRFKRWFKRPNVDMKEPLIDNNEGHAISTSDQTTIHIPPGTSSFTYTRHVLAEELDEVTFQVSPTFKEVIRVSESSGVEAWDLKTKTRVFGPFYDINYVERQTGAYSRVSSITEQAFTKLVSKKSELLNGTNIDLTKRTTLIQSSKENIIVAANASSQGLIQRRNQMVFDVEFEDGKRKDSHSIYVVNCNNPEYRRSLKGRNLEPEKGLAISYDGRYIACFTGGNASKIVVWSVYASDQLLPDYNLLSLTLKHGINHREGIMQGILPLMDAFGTNFFMFRHSSGMSILNEAIYYFNSYLLRIILECAVRKRTKVSFLLSKKSQVWDPISSSLNVNKEHVTKRSPKTLYVMLKYLLKRVTHEVEVERILTHSLVPILQHYPTIFIRIIRDPRLFAPGHEIEAPEHVLEGRKFIAKTSDGLNLSEKEAREFWKEQLSKDHPNIETSPTMMATVSTLPYEDATKIACKGQLHKLLINKARYFVFGAFLIQVIVDFKWRKYGKRIMLHESMHHIALLGAYMVYCFMLCIDSAYKMGSLDRNEANSDATRISLYICMVLAIPCFYREMRQCILYARKDGLCGFFNWLGSAWNGMEVLSYLVIVIVIPLAEFYFFREGRKSIILSSIVALESLLLWTRVLYYARTMPRIGTFATVMSSVVSAVLPFLLIAFCVVFGFAVAFHVLYRHVDVTSTERTKDSDEDGHNLLCESFGTFGRTLFTVFGFTFGEFDLKEIYHAPAGSIAIVLFVLYMVTVSTTLLNMLIAVMTKKFNGIRGRERIRFIQARAMAIGDNESMMSSEGRTKINSEMGKYLHIMTPAFGHARLFKGLRQSAIPINNDMTRNVQRGIRRVLARSHRRSGMTPSSRTTGRRSTRQQALSPSPHPLDTVQESGELLALTIGEEEPPVVADREPYPFDSENTDSESSDEYSDEDSD